MPSLKSTRFLTHAKVVHIPFEQTLKALHDPVLLIDLNPLVVKHAVSPSDPKLYMITDKISVLGFINSTTTYTAEFTKVDDGMSTLSNASMGTTLRGRWRARGVSGGTEVTEEVSVTTFIFAMPYVFGEVKKAHGRLLDSLVSKLENRNPAPVTSTESSRLGHLSLIAIACIAVVAIYIFSRPETGLFELYRNYDARIALALCILLGFFSIALTLAMIPRDPYDLFHLPFNKLPGECPDTGPRTEWLNMGFWKDTDVFPEACQALALKLVHSSLCEGHANVLDVGHGTGESLILLLSHPQVPRPAQLTGITSLQAHHQRSLQRLEQLKSASSMATSISWPEVTLYMGDAVYRPPAISHPLSPASPAPVYNTILALDCAYHFNTRRDFLHQSYHRLAPGGHIALADICFSPRYIGTFRTRIITSVLRFMPKANIISTTQYVQDMEAIGYVDISLENISENVFPGFVGFLQSRGWGWMIFGSIMKLYVYAGAQFVIASGVKGSNMDY